MTKPKTSRPIAALRKAISLLGRGPTDTAKLLGVTPGAVSNWIRGHSLCSPAHAAAIEALTDGAVSRAAIRPDIFK